MPHRVHPRLIIGQYFCPILDALYGDDKKPSATTTGAFRIGLTDPGPQSSHTCSALPHSRCDKRRGGCTKPLSEWAATIVRGRYHAMLPPEDVSHMPTAAKATIRASRLKFVTADRGHVRQSNDQSVDTRAKFFAGWLQSQGHTQQSVTALNPDQLIDTIGAFLESVKSGNNLQKIQLTGQSLRNYTTAAAICIKLLTGTMPQYFDPAILSQKRIYLHPYLHDKIAQRTTWTKPQLQKEPFTYRCLLYTSPSPRD